MYYLQVEHSNDEDCDLFKFNSLDDCIAWMKENEITQFILSDVLMGNYLESDYDNVKDVN